MGGDERGGEEKRGGGERKGGYREGEGGYRERGKDAERRGGGTDTGWKDTAKVGVNSGGKGVGDGDGEKGFRKGSEATEKGWRVHDRKVNTDKE